jgi:hypothetical protein
MANHRIRRFMNRLKELKELRAKAESLQLDNAEILRKYNMQQLCSIYNGIGPDSFPEWLRSFISALHPSLAVVALIHDAEWHESDKSKEKFAGVQFPPPKNTIPPVCAKSGDAETHIKTSNNFFSIIYILLLY